MADAFHLEIYFLTVTCVCAAAALRHMRRYWNWAMDPRSTLDLKVHRRFVATQMGFSIVFLGAFLPALAIGIYQTWSNPGLASLLPVPLYFVPRFILQPARDIEPQLRDLVSSDPAVQRELDHITCVWRRRLLPIF